MLVDVAVTGSHAGALHAMSIPKRARPSQGHSHFISQAELPLAESTHALNPHTAQRLAQTLGEPYPPTTWAAGAGPWAGPGAARCVMTAERRYQGRSPKPPPVWAGSRLSKGLGVAVMAFSLFQSMVLFRVLRSVCHGGLWSPNQSYLATAQRLSLTVACNSVSHLHVDAARLLGAALLDEKQR